ncbi:hypothetical protein [Gaetbulibacter aestuarii]|uniref:Tetratricopeptide repeat protein n=1 Tax=Gaetbulibacter aestuarii TaxID=1502358 RepID=A0ABW7N553_9FLAO
MKPHTQTLFLSIGIAFIVFLGAVILSLNQWKRSENSFKKQKETDKRLTIIELTNLKRSQPDLTYEEYLSLASSIYNISKEEIKVLLKVADINKEDDFNLAMQYYANNDYQNAYSTFNKLISPSYSLEIRAISYSYLGSIKFRQLKEYTPETLGYFLNAKELFEIINSKESYILQTKANNYYDIALLSKFLGHNQKSEESYRNAILTYKEINFEGNYNLELGMVFNDFYILSKQYKLEKSPIYYLNKAIKYKALALDDDPSIFNLRIYLNSINAKANYFVKARDYKAGINEFKSGLDKINTIVQITPSNEQYKLIKSKFLSQFAELYLQKALDPKYHSGNDIVSAEKKLNLALESIENISFADPVDLLTESIVYYDLGSMNRLKGDYRESFRYFTKCLEIRKDLVQNHQGHIDFLSQMAGVQFEIARLFSENSNMKNCKNVLEYGEQAKQNYLITKKFIQRDNHWYKEIIKIMDDCR